MSDDRYRCSFDSRVAHGAEVIAVEPSDAMRVVLERMVPEATALAGAAESIPLPDESADLETQILVRLRPDGAHGTGKLTRLLLPSRPLVS